jgi:uncharacterized protein YcbK (DUF882 family)
MAKYFNESEFLKCNPRCSMKDMNVEFMDLLDRLREIANIPIVLNCAYRNREYDLKKGRSGNSAHCKGLAVDIRCYDSTNRYKIIKAAIELGITRIGIGNGFIHIDNDETLPQNVIWYYY